MKKREVFMLSSLTFSLGIVVGFLISPIKQGITNYGISTTNNYNYNYKKHSTTTEES